MSEPRTPSRSRSIAGTFGGALALNVLAFLLLAVLVGYAVYSLRGAERAFAEEWTEFQHLLAIPDRCSQIVSLALHDSPRSATEEARLREDIVAVEAMVARLQDAVAYVEVPTAHDAEEAERVDDLASRVRELTDTVKAPPEGENLRVPLLRSLLEIRTLVGAIRKEDAELVDDALASLHQLALNITVGFIVVALTLLGCLAVGGILLRRHLREHLDRLQAGAEALSRGQFDRRVDGGAYAELQGLANHYNVMADRLSAMYQGLEDEIEQRTLQVASVQRMAAVGEIASGVAHEIGTPLASIAGCAEGLEARIADGTLEPEQLAEYLRIIREAAYRCKRVTRDLLELGHRREPEQKLVDLVEVTTRSVGLAHHASSAEGPGVQIDADPRGVHVQGDPTQLGQVVTNLVLNALQSGSSAPVEVTVGRRGGVAVLAVKDQGEGIASADLGLVFEPFHSTRAEGTGLGLTVSRDISSAHGGTIDVESAGVGEGAVFTLTLPRSESP